MFLEHTFDQDNFLIASSRQKQPEEHLGVTPAISLDKPSPSEVGKTTDLRNALRYYEGSETIDSNIISKLEELFKQWIREHFENKQNTELGGRVFAFGTYRLGVVHKGADIDALCVASCIITESDFFDSFAQLLKQQPEVTKCRAVVETFDPVIKMKIHSTNINLSFARLSSTTVPDDLDLRDDSIMENLDLSSMRSLNGCRTTEEILNLVPNIETFSLALRAIVMWAKKNSVYAHSLGYLNGVSWAMLVARTCQLYPNAAASTVVQKFFLVFSRWRWPRPILLDHPENINLVIDGFLPIIKPKYPEQDLANNVSQSTRNVILQELWRGLCIANEVMSGRSSWEHLFKEPFFANFLLRYPDCIMILVHSQTEQDHLVWTDLVESKIRVLVGSLERNPHISMVHPYAKTFNFKKGSSDEEDVWAQDAPSLFPSPFCTTWFVGLDLVSDSEGLNIDLAGDIETFTRHVLQHGTLSHVLKHGMSIEANHVKL